MYLFLMKNGQKVQWILKENPAESNKKKKEGQSHIRRLTEDKQVTKSKWVSI